MKKQLAEVVDGTEIKETIGQEILYSCENNGANDLCSTKKYATCGDYCGTTAPRYLEVLEFTHFVTMFEFDGNGENYKNKKLIDRITVSVVLDLGCGNTKN